MEMPEDGNDVLEVSSAVDTTLAYTCEKLASIENLLLSVLSEDIDIGAIDVENDSISSELIEKAFTFDVLWALLNSELREVENVVSNTQRLIVDSLHKLSSSEHEHSTELLSKLRDSEELLKHSQERWLDVKIRLVKLQMTSFSSKDGLHSTKPGIWTTEQRRTLRMLEKSLAGEIELEKKLKQLRQNEEDFKFKIGLIERVAISTEEAAEVAWGRFLEADNKAEVFMEISKDMMGKFQNVQSQLNSSTKRESEINSKLQDCIFQLNAKEASIQKLNKNIDHLIADNAEVTGLREKVRILEEKLKKTEARLEEANTSSEMSQKQLKEMEGEIESLGEKLYAAESRAETAEEKGTHLTESNLELTEELDFLKSSNDSNAKKVSLLEKQLRDLDSQLQLSKASSESSQDQQTNLYAAIWDMETLIDELKQKVAESEGKIESTEQKCMILSETNSQLSKELEFERSKSEFMEMSLNQVVVEKKACADDVSIKTALIMSTIAQLAMERECIQEKLISLTKKNKLLREKLHAQPRGTFVNLLDMRTRDEKKVDLAGCEITGASIIKAKEISSESFQVNKSLDDASTDENEAGPSTCENDSTNLVMELEAKKADETRTFTLMGIVVVLLSVLAVYLLHIKVEIIC